MAMLAEPKHKVKWCLNPRGKFWSEDENKFGQKLLQKMGWKKGKGLGKNEDGDKEHIKVTYKNDSKGLGYMGNNDKWIAHEDDFNSLLSSLNENYSCSLGSANCVTSTPQLQNLEERSRMSKSRVHYQRLIQGKNLCNMSKKDMECIFGRQSKESNQLANVVENDLKDETESDNCTNLTGVPTFTSTTNLKDYFSNKMQLLNKKKLLEKNANSELLKADKCGDNKSTRKNKKVHFNEVVTVVGGTAITTCNLFEDDDDRSDGSSSGEITGFNDSANEAPLKKKRKEPNCVSLQILGSSPLSIESHNYKHVTPETVSESVKNTHVKREQKVDLKDVVTLDLKDNSNVSSGRESSHCMDNLNNSDILINEKKDRSKKHTKKNSSETEVQISLNKQNCKEKQKISSMDISEFNDDSHSKCQNDDETKDHSTDNPFEQVESFTEIKSKRPKKKRKTSSKSETSVYEIEYINGESRPEQLEMIPFEKSVEKNPELPNFTNKPSTHSYKSLSYQYEESQNLEVKENPAKKDNLKRKKPSEVSGCKPLNEVNNCRTSPSSVPGILGTVKPIIHDNNFSSSQLDNEIPSSLCFTEPWQNLVAPSDEKSKKQKKSEKRKRTSESDTLTSLSDHKYHEIRTVEVNENSRGNDSTKVNENTESEIENNCRLSTFNNDSDSSKRTTGSLEQNQNSSNEDERKKKKKQKKESSKCKDESKPSVSIEHLDSNKNVNNVSVCSVQKTVRRNDREWLISQKMCLKMTHCKAMLEKLKEHKILSTSNLLSIKGYGNW